MDKNMELNSALFRKNGNCGYVLKPIYQSPKKTLVSIKIISGSQLQYNKSDSFSPLIELEVLGHLSDCYKVRTKAIKSDGHIVLLWKETFEFELQYPFLDFIRFIYILIQISSSRYRIPKWSLYFFHMLSGKFGARL
jgi:hypothetical protein